MGRPYANELTKLEKTYQWATDLPIGRLSEFFREARFHPLVAVGSGGSVTAAHVAALLHERQGGIAKVCTPLDVLQLGASLREASLLLISAGGRNTDILAAFEAAAKAEPRQLMVLSLQEDTPLSHLSSNFRSSHHLAAVPPCGKDGFLATNSLVAFTTMMVRAVEERMPFRYPGPAVLEHLQDYTFSLRERGAWAVLHSGWASPVAVDIESKFTEAALGCIQLADYRNFGHGRHHWFAKREQGSGIVALVTPENELLADRTLGLLPNTFPKIQLKTAQDGPSGTLDLMIQAMHLVRWAGAAHGIDPGRPGVPQFGSRLYHLRVPKPKPTRTRPSEREDAAIQRKACSLFATLSQAETERWRTAHRNFIEGLQRAGFGAVVFDYDGTLCSAEERFTGMSASVSDELARLLRSGMTIGIATGRGRSVRDDLQRHLPRECWPCVLVGYYNGSDIGTLDDNHRPDATAPVHPALQKLVGLVQVNDQLARVVLWECRPQQMTIKAAENASLKEVEALVLQIVAQSRATELRVLESGHSFDIVTPLASKLNLVEACRATAEAKGRPAEVLCIGDRGRWPGNDYELLSGPFSLSVDEVSPSMESCWRLCPPGVRGIQATQWYLGLLRAADGEIRMDFHTGGDRA